MNSDAIIRLVYKFGSRLHAGNSLALSMFSVH